MFTFPLLLTIYAGFTHAFEADHLLAVSSIVSQRNHSWSSMKDGVFWGLGHSSTIFIIGILMILFKIGISEQSFHYFEAVVGLMLIVLAIYRLMKFIQGKKLVVHQHSHSHQGTVHQHLHIHFNPKKPVGPMRLHQHLQAHEHTSDHTHPHTHQLAYGVGLVHGLAGSGALAVLVMAQITSPFEGLAYLLIFCGGCIGGMFVAAGLFSVPFSKKIIQAPKLQNALVIGSSLLCLLYGGKVIFENVIYLGYL